MTDDVADDGSAFGLGDLFFVDAKERALVDGLRGKHGRGFAGAYFELVFDDFDGCGFVRGALLRGHPVLSSFPYGTIRFVTKNDSSIAVVGAGNWGSSLVAALRRAGLGPDEIVGRDWRRARMDARVIWLCVPDVAIAQVAERIADRRRSLSEEEVLSGKREVRGERAMRGQIVMHSSGALPADVLGPVALAGASVAAVHPVMSFPTRRIVPLEGVMFGVEARDAAARRELSALVRRIGGVPFAVTAETKALYHAAGVMSSPLLVSALAAAMETAELAGLEEKTAARWVRALAEATARNVFARGPERSFSGPFARGDAGTIHLHLEALAEHPILADVYRSLARYAIARLPVKNRRDLERALGRGSRVASNLK